MTVDRVAAAQRLADEELFPFAQEMDRVDRLPRSRFDGLASAGLFDFSHDEPGTVRRAIAAISSGCGATFFSWVQHHGVLRVLAGSSNESQRRAWLAKLQSGEALGGTAFAHVRRSGPPAIRATRVDAGWRLDGFAPWATSWGLADVFTVAAESSDGEIVWSLLPGTGQPGLIATPLQLAVFSSTGTVAFAFDGVFVPDDRVLAVEPAAAWRVADRQRSAGGQPGVLGVAARAIDLLMPDAARSGDEGADAAGRLGDRLAGVWDRDDELRGIAEFDDAAIAAASDHRAACLMLAADATRALLASVGGAGMDLSHPAQRLAREAAFYVIQAQTADGRAATLRSVV